MTSCWIWPRTQCHKQILAYSGRMLQVTLLVLTNHSALFQHSIVLLRFVTTLGPRPVTVKLSVLLCHYCNRHKNLKLAGIPWQDLIDLEWEIFLAWICLTLHKWLTKAFRRSREHKNLVFSLVPTASNSKTN